jgi:hypothetical protein
VSEQGFGITYGTYKALKDELAAKDAELARLRGVVEDYEESYRATMSETCDGKDDRVHCTCVPDLRRGIAAARAKALLDVIHLLAPDGEASSEHEREVLDEISRWRTASLPSPAEAGEKPCRHCGFDKGHNPFCPTVPFLPAAPSDAKAGEL